MLRHYKKQLKRFSSLLVTLSFLMVGCGSSEALRAWLVQELTNPPDYGELINAYYFESEAKEICGSTCDVHFPVGQLMELYFDRDNDKAYLILKEKGHLVFEAVLNPDDSFDFSGPVYDVHQEEFTDELSCTVTMSTCFRDVLAAECTTDLTGSCTLYFNAEVTQIASSQ